MNRKLDRREFLTRTTLGAASLGLAAHGLAAAAERQYPFASADEAFRAADFDPRQSGNAVFAVAADCHYGSCRPDGLLPIIDELNALQPLPAFFLIAGDMICSASVCFGHRPDERGKEKAVDEFRKCRAHLNRLDPAIERKLVLGNHDTSPDETEPILFHRVFPEHPAYQSFDLAGVHYVLLNGHGDGRIDEEQRQWFVKDMGGVEPDCEVITFVHQPSLGGAVAEREIGPAYERALADHRGPVWAICGHSHHNGDTVFSLPHTTIAQTSVVCSAEGIWGGPEKPGYWLYLVRNGHMVGRVFRRLGYGYRIAKLPDRTATRRIPKPFDTTDGIRWKVLVGENDRPYLVEHNAGDNVTAWCYVKKLVYRMPLDEADGKATEIAVLASFPRPNADGTANAFVRLSVDGQTWQPAEIPAPDHGVYRFPIPAAFRSAPSVLIEIVKPKDMQGSVMVGGFALV